MIVCEFAGGYDPLDPNGNITVKWDILDWNDGTYDVSPYTYVVFFAVLSFILSTSAYFICTVYGVCLYSAFGNPSD